MNIKTGEIGEMEEMLESGAHPSDLKPLSNRELRAYLPLTPEQRVARYTAKVQRRKKNKAARAKRKRANR